MAETHSIDELAALVRENYAARERGELPDKMFWADAALMKMGYVLNDAGEPERISDSQQYPAGA